MKILVKTVTKQMLEVELEESGSVGDLFEKVTSMGYEVKKLVYKGKVLDDKGASLSSTGIVENVTVIMIGSKAAIAPPKPAEEPKEEPKAEAPKAESSTPAAPAASSSEASASAAGAFVTGDELDSTISTIMAMGDWPREKVLQALQAAYNNPDRAVEFLLSGNIPQVHQAPPAPAASPAGGAPTAMEEDASAQPQAVPVINIPGIGEVTPSQIARIMGILQEGREGQQPPTPEAVQRLLAVVGSLAGAQAAAQGAGAQAAPAAAPASGGAMSPLAQALSQIQELPQIRAAVAADPRMLERVMGTLRNQSPELFALINENQQEFISILRNGLPGQEGAAGAPQGVPPGAVVISESDRAAITRLQQLGFSEQQAAQAYLLADRNEELAANLLFDGTANMDQD